MVLSTNDGAEQIQIYNVVGSELRYCAPIYGKLNPIRRTGNGKWDFVDLLKVYNARHDHAPVQGCHTTELICESETQYVKDEIQYYMEAYPVETTKTFITIDDDFNVTKYVAQNQQTVKFNLQQVNRLESGEYDFVGAAHELLQISGYCDFIVQASFGDMKFVALTSELMSNSNMTLVANKILTQMLQIGACIALRIVSATYANNTTINAEPQVFTVATKQ